MYKYCSPGISRSTLGCGNFKVGILFVSHTDWSPPQLMLHRICVNNITRSQYFGKVSIEIHFVRLVWARYGKV